MNEAFKVELDDRGFPYKAYSTSIYKIDMEEKSIVFK